MKSSAANRSRSRSSDSNRSPEEIPGKLLAKLRAAAAKAAKKAYCPYSHFPVGAAVLTKDGKIFTGCNVENASYGLTICAERNAIFAAVAAGAREIAAVAVFTPTSEATAPCGACRQVILEFGPSARVYCFGLNGPGIAYLLPELLPGAFGPSNLEASHSPARAGR
jgi:cytidine deaminase